MTNAIVTPQASALQNPVRFSHLRAYGKSAAHGLHARMNDDAMGTAAMQRGTAVHALLFNTRKVVSWDGAVRRGKAFDAFKDYNQDAEILTANEYEKAAAMARTIRDNKQAMALLDGETEKTIYFKWYGIECRATPDVRGNGFVTELKTSATSDPNRFVWHALRMNYNAQLRMQQIACGHDIMSDLAYIVAVESEAPFNVTVFHVQYRALEAGERNLSLWMERLKSSESSGSWPPYCESIVPLDIPEDYELDYGDE